MAGSVIRFLQASDLDLHRPLVASWQVPAGLRESLAGAAYTAAERVFDAAIAERVDFMLLAGNTCDPRHVGVRGLVFLQCQFERLRDEGIDVFWSHGHDDRANRWPAAVSWPGNVYRFTQPSPETHRFEHHHGSMVEIVGNSWTRRTSEPAALLATGGDGVLSIAVTGGQISAASTTGRGPRYWAIGGTPDPATEETDGEVVHWSGTPQGRDAGSMGSRGCSVIEMGDNNQFDIRHVSCDVLRWTEDELPLGGTPASVEEQIIARADDISRLHDGRLAAVTWDLGSVPASTLEHRLRPLAAQWIDRLSSDIQERFDNLLVAGIHWNTPFDENAFEEDSLRGSFLRSLGSLLDEKRVASLLEDSLPSTMRETLARELCCDDAATMAMLADQVASLGDSLLDGTDRDPAGGIDIPEAA